MRVKELREPTNLLKLLLPEDVFGNDVEEAQEASEMGFVRLEVKFHQVNLMDLFKCQSG